MRSLPGLLRPATIFAALLLFFSSCMTPKKVDRWTAAHYSTAITTPRKTDYIVIKDAAFSPATRPSTTVKKKAKMLPLLFYWKWKIGTHTELDPTIPRAVFASAVIPYANSKRLKQKLDGKSIELVIDEAPASFSVMDEGWLVFLLFGSVHNEKMYIDPDKKELAISYRILKDNEAVKTGKITIQDPNGPVNFKVFKSGKKTFSEYLEKYNANIQAMGRETVDKILNEL